MTTLYRLYKGDALLYIGVTADLSKRLREHALNQPWWTPTIRATSEQFSDRTPALAAEAKAIREERPLHNVIHRPGGRKEPADSPERADPSDVASAAAEAHRWMAERNALIGEALKAGASQREVAQLAGLTQPAISGIWQRAKGGEEG